MRRFGVAICGLGNMGVVGVGVGRPWLTTTNGVRTRITCLGLDGTLPRVYWLNPSLMEAHPRRASGWFSEDLVDFWAYAPHANSAVTSFAVGQRLPRVYYSNDSNNLIEQGFYAEVNDWAEPDNLSQDQRAPLVASGSGMACFGVGGTDPRVYYFDEQDRLIEMAYLPALGWRGTNLGQDHGAPAPNSGRLVTCFGAGGVSTRVYYFDQHNNIIEVAWGDDQQWHANNISGPASAPSASPISSLTCFGVNGWATRIYYFDSGLNVVELGYGNDNRWYAANVGSAAGAPTAYAPSGLTCFGVNGWASRVYYFDYAMNLIELGWGADNRWYSGNLTSAGAAPQANGPLTCFGVNGALTRVYYKAGSPVRIWEIAFSNGGWHSQAVSSQVAIP